MKNFKIHTFCVMKILNPMDWASDKERKWKFAKQQLGRTKGRWGNNNKKIYLKKTVYGSGRWTKMAHWCKRFMINDTVWCLVEFWWNFCSHVNNCLETRINTSRILIILNAVWILYSVFCRQSKFFKILNMKLQDYRHNFRNSSVWVFSKPTEYNGR